MRSSLICITTLALLVSWAAAAENDPGLPSEVFEWPCWKGPVGGGVAPDPGFPLVDSLEQAKLVWESEDTIPLGVEKGPEWGSFSSPVLADGRLFICYVRPPGKEVFDVPEGKSRGQLEQTGFDGDAWKVEDVMHCFDLKTGKTLWRYVYPKGQRGRGGKNGGHYLACVDSGYVCAVGSCGRLYCVEAATGKFAWDVWMKKPAGRANPGKSYQELIEESYKSGKNLIGVGFNHAPGAVSGVVAMGFDRANVHGFDIKTGEKLWSVKVQGCRGRSWVHGHSRHLETSWQEVLRRRQYGYRAPDGEGAVEFAGSRNRHRAVRDRGLLCQRLFFRGRKRRRPHLLAGGCDGRYEALEHAARATVRACTATDVICGEYFVQETNKPATECHDTGRTGHRQTCRRDTSFRTFGYSPLSCRNQIYCGMYRRNNITVSPTGLTHTYEDPRNGPGLWANSCSAAMANGYLYHRTINRVCCWDLAKQPRSIPRK